MIKHIDVSLISSPPPPQTPQCNTQEEPGTYLFSHEHDIIENEAKFDEQKGNFLQVVHLLYVQHSGYRIFAPH